MKRFLALVVLAALAAGGWLAWSLFQPYFGASDKQIVDIAPGTGTVAISDLLVSHGVLSSKWPFLARTLVGRLRHRRLKAGEYLFDHALTAEDVYRKLAAGDIVLHTVVIPEGSDRFDIARILSDTLAIDPNDFLNKTEKTALIQDLDPKAPSLEGYLFPDTYRFPSHVTANTVIATMVTRFRHVLQTKLQADVAGATNDLHTAVTLASLVEKETPDPAEKPVVAGVFALRLEKGMPLQCDPTVIYAARLAGHPSAIIHVSDLKFNSPYNTYVNPGLPPGPIANPGEESLRAALHPAAGEELYFVSNNHGGHVFSKTLEEHQRNVARYRRELSTRNQKPSAAKRPSTPGAGQGVGELSPLATARDVRRAA